ncbi:MAG: phosphoribosylanthranilate isomerase [Methylococcus sp.]|jgi:phosphoribosylanthranilate isomerase|nr:MAG: phosphoribosylanthranilate isomerase [Methylococcus sp.]
MNAANYHPRVRVKICGFTRRSDAVNAAILGVDAIGLVFYSASPRCVSPDTAADIVRALPPFVTVVALFVDEQPETIRDILRQVPVDLLQFHGDESPESCGSFRVPYIKAVRMNSEVDIEEIEQRYSGARGLLLDAYHPDQKGGTGLQFDWDLIPRKTLMPVVLAGGLNPDNVQDALGRVGPFAVDVSSGVESGKGLKDMNKVAAFLREVQGFDCRTDKLERT